MPEITERKEAIGIIRYGGGLKRDRKYPKGSVREFLGGSSRALGSVNYPLEEKVLKDYQLFEPDIASTGTPNPEIGKSAVDTAKEFEEEGIRLIGTNCGFFAYFHDLMANAVVVPVASSSLLQIPLIIKVIGKGKRVGILTWDARYLTEEHLRRAGVHEPIKTAIVGLETSRWRKQFGTERWGTMTPAERLELLEDSLVDAAKQLVSKYDDIGAILLECSLFPPGAYAVQKATGLPVWDFSTILNWAGNGVFRRRVLPL